MREDNSCLKFTAEFTKTRKRNMWRAQRLHKDPFAKGEKKIDTEGKTWAQRHAVGRLFVKQVENLLSSLTY